MSDQQAEHRHQQHPQPQAPRPTQQGVVPHSTVPPTPRIAPVGTAQTAHHADHPTHPASHGGHSAPAAAVAMHPPRPAGTTVTPPASGAPTRTIPPGGMPAKPAVPPTALPPRPVLHDEPIELVDDEMPTMISPGTPPMRTPTATGAAPVAATAPPVSKIHQISAAGTTYNEHWTRVPFKTQNGAIRVRSFYGRLSDQGLGFLDHQINDWLEKNPEIEIKQVTSNVGLFDGKLKELALVLNLWY